VAEEEEQEEKEDDVPVEAAPPSSRVNQFVVLVIVVLIGQGALAYMLVNKIVVPKQRAADAEEAGEVLPETELGEADKIPVKIPLLQTFEEILLNPRDEAGIRFLRVQVIVEVENEEVLGEMQESAGKVTVVQLRELLARTMNNMPFHMLDGPEDRVKLRENLKGVINESGLLVNGEVKHVYFGRFILQ
jgi:flagellar basal body-associated protein FliL